MVLVPRKTDPYSLLHMGALTSDGRTMGYSSSGSYLDCNTLRRTSYPEHYRGLEPSFGVVFGWGQTRKVNSVSFFGETTKLITLTKTTTNTSFRRIVYVIIRKLFPP